MKKNEQDEAAEKVFYENLSKPFILTRIIFKHPCIIILTGVAITILCTIAIIAANSMQMDDIKSNDLLVKSDYRVKRQDSVDVAEETIDKLLTTEYIENSASGDGMPLRTQTANDQTTIIMYKNADGNLFTEENLKKMFEIENNLITRDDEKIKLFCKAQSTTDDSCSDDSRFRVTGLFKENMSQSEIDAKLKEIATDDDLFSAYKILFGEDFTQDNPTSKLARSIFKFAMPIEINGHRYKDIYDEFDDQNEEFNIFMYDFYQYIEDSSSDGMSVYLFASDFELYVVMQIALKDDWNALNYYVLTYCFCPQQIHFLCFIFLYDESYCFISNFGNFSSLEKRFNFTYKKAIRQISTTTSTTVFNFFMTAITPLLPIGSFGSFAVALVLCNYFLVLSFYPSMFIFYAQFMEKRRKKKQANYENKENNDQMFYFQQFQIFSRQDANDESPQEFIQKQPMATNNNEAIVNKEECIKLQISPNGAENAKKEQALQAEGDSDFIQNENSVNNYDQNQQKQEEAKPNLIERFFDKFYSPFLYKARFAFLVFFIAWFGISLYFTAKLKAPKEATQTAPDDCNIKMAKDMILDFNAAQSDNVITIDLVWGIKGIDRDTISDRWDSSDRGDVIWDDTFDLTLPEVQERIYEICQDLRANYMNTELIQDNGVNCFMENFKEFAESKGYNFPVSQNGFMSLFIDFTETDQGVEFASAHNFGLIDGKIKYAKIICYGTTMLIQQKDLQLPLLNQWEEIMENYNKNSPDECNQAVQTAGFGWVWMVTEDKLISNTITSLIATGAFAFFVLSCSTLNLIAALYSTLSIIGIVICILGLIKMFGWYLGLIETIAASIVVGFSVEYIVFLCIYYLILNFDTRYQKVRQSLTSMGISILGGAITTLGAGVFLVMGEMEFFSKMGILLIFTIIFSLLWSLGFFSSLLMVCGPMGNMGSILYIFSKIKEKFKKKD